MTNPVLAYRPDIDGLRMIAVFPVVLFHAGIPGFSGGFVGVDVFFVISGFLITSIIQRELGNSNFSILKFYERRARRILPALISVIVFSFALGLIYMLPSALESLAWSSLFTLSFASNVWFWNEGNDYFGSASEYFPLLHTWSLAVEEQFYIVFPLFLMAFARFGSQLRLVAVGMIVVGSFALSVYAVPRMPSAAFFLSPTRFWEIGIGALLALGAAPNLKIRWVRELVGGLSLSSILVAVFVYDHNTPFPGVAALLPCLGAAGLLWVGSSGSSLSNRALSLKPFVWIGLISYSLYLWHWPILAFIRLEQAHVELSYIQGTAAVVLSFVLATASWRFVEQPFRTNRFGVFSQCGIFAWSAVSITVAAGASAALLLANGLPQRMPQDVARVLNDARPDPFSKSCEGLLPKDGLCAIGAEEDDTTPSFLLLGDSHSVAIVRAVDSVAKDAGVRGLYIGNVSCAPIQSVLSGQPERHRECLNFMDEAVTLATSNDEIDLILIASRWPVVVEGKLMPGEAGSDFPVKVANSDEDNFAVVSRELPKTVDAFRAPGRRIVLVGSVPEIGWNVPDQVIRDLRRGGTTLAPPTLASTRERQARSTKILNEIAKHRRDVEHVEITPTMCTPLCATHDGGTTYYWDDDHLTPAGAKKFVAPLLDQYFKDADK